MEIEAYVVILVIGIGIAYIAARRMTHSTLLARETDRFRDLINEPALKNLYVEASRAGGLASTDDHERQKPLTDLLNAHLVALQDLLQKQDRDNSRKSFLQNTVFFLLGIAAPLFFKLAFGIG